MEYLSINCNHWLRIKALLQSPSVSQAVWRIVVGTKRGKHSDVKLATTPAGPTSESIKLGDYPLRYSRFEKKAKFRIRTFQYAAQ